MNLFRLNITVKKRGINMSSSLVFLNKSCSLPGMALSEPRSLVLIGKENYTSARSMYQ